MTVFNRAQIAELQKELETLRFRVTDEAVRSSKDQYLRSASNWPSTATAEATRYASSLSTADLVEHLTKVLTLVANAASHGPHHYVRFVGD